MDWGCKMTTGVESEFVTFALLRAREKENLNEDGSVNWDFVESDLQIDNDIGNYRREDIDRVLKAASILLLEFD